MRTLGGDEYILDSSALAGSLRCCRADDEDGRDDFSEVLLGVRSGRWLSEWRLFNASDKDAWAAATEKRWRVREGRRCLGAGSRFRGDGGNVVAAAAAAAVAALTAADDAALAAVGFGGD